MSQRTFRTIMLLLLPSCLATVARSETAAEAFSKGEELVLKGEFDGALVAYANAVRGDRSNQEYLQHYSVLRRVIQLRALLGQETNDTRWESLARSLHAFYVDQKILPEALTLGRQMHDKLANASSAANLAEVQLAMGLNDDAVKTLAGLDAGKKSAVTESLLGIASARVGQTDRAKQIVASIELPQDADSQTRYAAARLYAAIGNAEKAMEVLAQCLASLPPSGQQKYVELAKESPEFASMANSPEFAAALKTESKVPESKCSGGKSCAGCPMRGQCPSGQAK